MMHTILVGLIYSTKNFNRCTTTGKVRIIRCCSVYHTMDQTALTQTEIKNTLSCLG